MTSKLSPARFNHPDHPLRPPAWRWFRAADLADNRQSAEEGDDGWVRQALRFCLRLRQSPGAAGQEALAQDMPALYQAHSLFTGPPSLTRWEIEARLLTDEPFDRIALKCGSTPAVITAYEQFFFCIRDRLEAAGYLVNVVLGGDLLTRLREDDVGKTLKLFAFGGGVAVLEAVLEYFRHPPVLPERPELLPAADLVALRQKLLVKAAVVARGLPPDARVFKKLTLLAEARRAIAPDGGEADFPSLRSPPLPNLMSVFGEGVGNGKPVSAPVPMEPDPGRREPPCPNAQPFSHSVNGPAPRKGRQKVAVA